MALPQFAKASHPLGTPLIFSRQYSFPVDETRELNQVMGFSLGGFSGSPRQIKVLDKGGLEKRLILRWPSLPKTEVESVRAWLHHATINGAVNTFTFTDVFSVSYTVRYMAGIFSVSEFAYQLAALELELRVEG
jgi:hypothetical protein